MNITDRIKLALFNEYMDVPREDNFTILENIGFEIQISNGFELEYSAEIYLNGKYLSSVESLVELTIDMGEPMNTKIATMKLSKIVNMKRQLNYLKWIIR